MTAVVGRPASAKSTCWPVRASAGGLLGLGAALVLLAAGLALLLWSVRPPISPAAYAILAVGVLAVGSGAALASAALGYFRLSYELHPDRLIVRGAADSETILFDDVEGIYSGQKVGALRRVRGLSWPGYHVGVVRSRGIGALRVYCTDLGVESLSVIATADRTVVLSPRDPAAFRRELIRRIEDRQDSPPTAAAEPSRRPASHPHPAVAGLFAAAVALLVSLAWLLAGSFNALPELIGLYLDSTGRAATLVPRAEISFLPILGGAVMLSNLVLALSVRGRGVAAPVLLGATSALVQAVVLLAAFRVVAP